MPLALTLLKADRSRSARRCSSALLLSTIAGLLNACGGGASEPGPGGGAVACITGPAATVLNWDAVSGAAGYRIYSRTAGGNFTLLQDAGNSTTLPVNGLVSGTTYYFAATAYDSSGPPNESSFSNEVCKTIS